MTYGERLLQISTLSSGTASELIQNIVTGEAQPISGTIKLQRGVWQLISIPVEGVKVAEYLCDRLASQEGVNANDLIEVVNTYRGTEDKFFSYVPWVTSKGSLSNFQLIYNDNGSMEIAGIWVKMKEYVHTTNDLLFSWNSEDVI